MKINVATVRLDTHTFIQSLLSATFQLASNFSEMRMFYGPGYRIYYRQHGDVVTLLDGGDKDSQARDIVRA